MTLYKINWEMVIVRREEYAALASRSENEEGERDFEQGVASIEAGEELPDGNFVELLLDTESPKRELIAGFHRPP